MALGRQTHIPFGQYNVVSWGSDIIGYLHFLLLDGLVKSQVLMAK
jgi:hypothetical protein